MRSILHGPGSAKSLMAATLTLAIAFVSGVWIVGELVFGTLKDDVREIRDDFKRLTAEDSTIRGLLSGSELELRQQISDIRVLTADSNAKITFLVDDVALIKTSLLKRP